MARSSWPAWRDPESGERLSAQGDALVAPGGARYPIRGGIPRFVSGTTYADAFGVQWKHFRETQLDSFTGTSVVHNRIRRCLGEELWQDLAGKQVLECGCGAGCFTEVLLERGACVTSVDLSEAVEANAKSFPPGGRHRVAQADILHLPFAPQLFDVVFCLGVIQHTPEPEATIGTLYDQVKPGGVLVIDHYATNIGWYTCVKPAVRQVLKRLPPGKAMRYTERMVDLFLPLHRRARHSRLGQIILGRISPVIQYYNLYREFDEETQRQWALLDTHDALTDWYKHWRTRGQIRRTLERLGLSDIVCEYGGNGVEARGTRPVGPVPLAEGAGRTGGRVNASLE